MRSLILIIFAKLALAIVTHSVNNTSLQETKVSVESRIVCYYGSWSRMDAVIPGDWCTHIIFSFIGVDEKTWRYMFIDGDDQLTRWRIQQFLQLKQKFVYAKFLVAVGGASQGGGGFSQMAELPWRRRIFVNSIADLMKEWRFDGVDIDWEYPGVTWSGGRLGDKQTFPLLLQELRTALNNVGRPLELTIAVSIADSVIISGYDVPKLCGTVDAVHLMAYDLRGPWDEFADVHSALFHRPNDQGDNQKENFNYGGTVWYRDGCPAYKLIMGVPFYGHELVVNGDNRPGAVIDKDATYNLPDAGILPYNKLCKYFSDSTWKKTFDNEVYVPYMQKGNIFLSYDDARSLRWKAEWIKYYGFGGVMIWSIEMDDYYGDCDVKAPLISTLYSNLKDYTVSIS